MDENKLKRLVILCAAGIFAAALLIIAVTFFVISRAPDQIMPDIPAQDPSAARQVRISPNSGGSAPTPVPSATPLPLVGMESPLFCKLGLAGITGKAKEQGAPGILTLNKYDFGEKACVYDIRNTVGIGNLGRIEFFQDPDTGKNGIAVKISKAGDDALVKWGTAALMYFNSDIRADRAESSVRTALEEGSLDTGRFSISARKDVILDEGAASPVRVLEIRSNAVPEEINIVFR